MCRRVQLVVALALLGVASAGCGRARFAIADGGAQDAPILATMDALATIDAVTTSDASGLDAPGLDAFAPDTALDAASRDAPSTLDTLAPDAFALDARSLDAGPRDAGPCVITSLHPDRDGDGFGDPRQSFSRCPGAPGFVADATDCDDGSATSRPGGTETCNCRDDDCNGTVDELPACRAASHVVWARAYGGPSSDGPWQLATDDVSLHVVGQSWMGGFEILPGERTGGFEIYEARFDARSGLGLWGRGATSSSSYPIGVARYGDRLYTLLGSPIRLEVSDVARSSPTLRHASSGTEFIGGSYTRLAVASDTGVAFIHTGMRGSANVGLGSVASRGGSDSILYRVATDGSTTWQRVLGDTADEYERAIVASASGHRVAVAVYAPAPIDMGGGIVPGTDPWVIGLYDGATGAHVASSRRAEIDLDLAMANDGTLFVARVATIDVYAPDGTLTESRSVSAVPQQVVVTSDGDLVVAYGLSGATTIDGTLFTPSDSFDGVVVRYVGTSTTVRWAQQLDDGLQALIAGPSGDLYGVGGVPVSAPWSECGGISAPGGGDSGDADIVILRLH